MPDGSIYYTGAGQMWGPAGESADEALYALHQSYDPSYNDPVTGHWKVFGVGTFGARSGAFSVLLPLKAPYTSADVLTGGGTLGPPPGGYAATNFSELAHFTTDGSGKMTPAFSVGPMLTQNRWFSSTVTLPNDAVAVFSGANKDEVVDPGNESPVRQAEWYTPWDGQFHPLASAGRDRTYHNTAVLLPDGSVLVGGHAPIPAHYSYTNNIEHDLTEGTPAATANNFRDPSFEIYRPPYLFAGDRPVIEDVQSGIAWGRAFDVETRSAAEVSSVRLIRLPSLTHTVDANMRSIELSFTRHGDSLEVQAPPNGNIAPPGSYYLFINRGTGAGTVPSTAAIVNVGSTVNMAHAAIPFGTGRQEQASGLAHPQAAGVSAVTTTTPTGVKAPATTTANSAVLTGRKAAATISAPRIPEGPPVALVALPAIALAATWTLRRRRRST
jgi:hypothetical protein